jgi:hypothetical protein
MHMYAIMAMMAEEEDYYVQMSPYDNNTRTRDWAAEIVDHIRQQAWGTEEVARKAGKRIVAFPERNRTIIELGSGWEGATDGMKANPEIDRVVTVDCEPHNLGERGIVHPEIVDRFENAPEGELIQHVARRAAVRQEDIIGIWASPSCKEHSTANALGTNAGTGKGKYAGLQLSELELKGMHAVAKGIKQWHEGNPKTRHYFVENVAWGSMREDEIVNELLGAGKTLDGCAYGLKHQKPYRYWTSIPPAIWTPKSANGVCAACSSRPKRKHEQALCPEKGDKRSRPYIPGYTTKAAANRVPPALGKEVAAAFIELDNLENAT